MRRVGGEGTRGPFWSGLSAQPPPGLLRGAVLYHLCTRRPRSQYEEGARTRYIDDERNVDLQGDFGGGKGDKVRDDEVGPVPLARSKDRSLH